MHIIFSKYAVELKDNSASDRPDDFAFTFSWKINCSHLKLTFVITATWIKFSMATFFYIHLWLLVSVSSLYFFIAIYVAQGQNKKWRKEAHSSVLSAERIQKKLSVLVWELSCCFPLKSFKSSGENVDKGRLFLHLPVELICC